MPFPISELSRTKVREYTESHMDGLVTIVRGKRGGLDPVTGRVKGMTVDTVVYGSTTITPPGGSPTPPEQTDMDTGGKARLHVVTGQGSISNGAGDYDVRQVQVSIPWAAPQPYRDDVVIVRDPGQDDTLVGSTLRVIEVAGGGAFGDARRLSCTLWGHSEYWSGEGLAMTSLAEWQQILESALAGADGLGKHATKKADIEGSTGYRGSEIPGPVLTSLLRQSSGETGGAALREDVHAAAVPAEGRDSFRQQGRSTRTANMDPRVVEAIADRMAADLGNKGATLLAGL